MNQQDIIDMAKEAGLLHSGCGCSAAETFVALEKFAALVVSKDRERIRPANLLPQKEGQGSVMTITEGPDTSPPEVGHWYSPDKVASMLLADRQRLALGVDLPEPDMGTIQVHAKRPPVSLGYSIEAMRDYGDRRAAAENDACAKVIQSHAKEINNNAALINLLMRIIARCAS